jgi:hypothetical protein
VAPAPLPTPSVGTGTAQPGLAGAVASADGAAVVSWQPGALPTNATVSLISSPSRLALKGFGLALGIGATTPLTWPVDVTFATAPPDAVAGVLPGQGVWQAVSELTGTTLPVGQDWGEYRDSAGGLHLLTRRPGRVALFAADGWGDPRYATTAGPKLTFVSPLLAGKARARVLTLQTRFTVDNQAQLAVTVVGPTGRRITLLRRGSRIGGYLAGGPANTLESVQLRPGALPLRVRVLAARLKPGTRYRLRIEAQDPYRRHVTLTASFTFRG